MHAVDPDAQERSVFVLADHYQKIHTPWHSHRRLQLIHVSSGVLTVVTRQARYVVPPQRAVWVASGTEHRIESKSPFWLTTCYVEPGLIDLDDLPPVVAINPLVNELLIAASAFGGSYPETGSQSRLIAVLLDSFMTLDAADIALPEAKDKRLQRITELLLADPTCSKSLADLAKHAGLTERTAARLFLRDTGMTFGRWRQHMRLLRALEYLAQGHSVMRTATDVGYSDTSSFIAAFKLLFGKTPLNLLQDRLAAKTAKSN